MNLKSYEGQNPSVETYATSRVARGTPCPPPAPAGTIVAHAQ